MSRMTIIRDEPIARCRGKKIEMGQAKYLHNDSLQGVIVNAIAGGSSLSWLECHPEEGSKPSEGPYDAGAGNAVGEGLPAAGSAHAPVHNVVAVGDRTVLQGGYAALQDDKKMARVRAESQTRGKPN